MEIKLNQGFTLIELLVALSIAGILLGIGVPSFAEAVKESRISSQYNAMVGSLFLARSEAVKGPGVVTVCPREALGASQCGDESDWNNGWLVFIDRTTVQGEATAKVDVGDEIIAVEPGVKGDNTVMAIGSPTNSAADAKEVGFIRYTQSGGAQWASGSVILCDASRGPVSSRAINIVLTGDIRRGRVSSGSDAPRDAFNQPLTKHCPEAA
ncbi:MAG: prepilin-type N-terminal cleavage/methylation domain-containing protein [Granulosicoccus sp.]|nr:prepilin-type N-terminal cleavage/methylation domain-containing protein [Granulosicoccus sp.]